MMAALPAPACVIQSHDHIGEGPVWDADNRRLLWCDHATGVVHEARQERGEWCETRRWTLERPIAAAIPRVGGDYVVASGIEILSMDEEGCLEPFAKLDGDLELIKFNDAKCDASGRLWATTLAVDLERRAGLYRVDPGGGVSCKLDGLRLANGLAWSPDGATIYVVDSVDRLILAADFDMESGSVGPARQLVAFEMGEGGPNGLTIDDEGGLWIALTGGGEVRRYSPLGRLLARLEFPVPGPTSCAFGGEDQGTLFITSRSGRMPDFAGSLLGIPETMMESFAEEAGGLWVCQPGVSGMQSALSAT